MHFTSDELAWLGELRTCATTERAGSDAPARIAERLRQLGCVAPDGCGGWTVTERGRLELLLRDCVHSFRIEQSRWQDHRID
jgi:hypothetical protein